MSLQLQELAGAHEFINGFHVAFPEFRVTVGEVYDAQEADKTYSSNGAAEVLRATFITNATETDAVVKFNSAKLPTGDLDLTKWSDGNEIWHGYRLFDTVLLVLQKCSDERYRLCVLRTRCEQVFEAAAHAIINATDQYPELIGLLAKASRSRMNNHPTQYTCQGCYEDARNSLWFVKAFGREMPGEVAQFLINHTVIGARGDDDCYVVTVHCLVHYNKNVTKVYPLV